MLDPANRELLLEALRPDPGASLDHAVGTSFTLDLDAMILAPLAFALFETSGPPDPIALLAAIGQNAERIALYCDAGHIKVPAQHEKLYVLLEPSLLPVAAPRGGAFHPKLWVLRYRGADGAVTHRVLVLSRNLTFDTSWDLVAHLDEDDEGAPLGVDVAEALTALDGLAGSPVTRSLAESVRGARFAVPAPFDDVELRLLGTGRRGEKDPIAGRRGERVLVVSPFLSAGRLGALAALGSRDRWLVSRPDELERLGAPALEAWGTPLVLREGAGAEPPEAPNNALSGLHAKLVVLDDGERSTWFAGSMNATTSALERNVEACLLLSGPRRAAGVGALLSEAGSEVRFRTLLRAFPIEGQETLELTPEEREQERLEALGAQLARMDCSVRVTAMEGERALELAFRGDLPALEASDRVEARLVTRGRWRPVDLDSDPAAWLDVGRTSEITSLVAIRLRGAIGLEHELVLFGRLIDAPSDRMDRLLLDLVPDRARFARLLFLMLAAGKPEPELATTARRLISGSGTASGASDALDIPLFEALVRTSAAEPERLAGIDRLVRQLCATAEGRERLPDGFVEMWESFRPLVPERAR